MDKRQGITIDATPGEIREPTMQLHIVRGETQRKERQVWVDVPVIVDATEFRRG